MVDELGLINANLPEMDLQNLLEVSPPSPNWCVRFTLAQRSDGGPLVKFTTEQLSPVKRKLSAGFATDAETERDLEPGPTKITRMYNGKAKANIIEGKAAADGTSECDKLTKQTISGIK